MKGRQGLRGLLGHDRRPIGRRNTAVEAKTDSKRITADSTVREVVSRYPTTGPIFLQHGRMFRARAGELYASYDPPLTIREYAAVNKIDIEPLLRLLNAAAEAEECARKTSTEAGALRPEAKRRRDRGSAEESGVIGYVERLSGAAHGGGHPE